MPGTDPCDEPDEQLSFGSERWARRGAWLRGRVPPRVALPLAAVVVLVAAVITLTRHESSGDRPSAQRPSAQRTATSPAVATSPGSSSEYTSLYTVPAEDLRAFLLTRPCRTGCVANELSGSALTRAAAAFRGLTPLAGGTVTLGDGTVIFETIEALARPDALAHLVLRRTGAAGVRGPSLQQRSADGARTAVVRQARAGWQLTASLVVRDTDPPLVAALHWSATTRLPS